MPPPRATTFSPRESCFDFADFFFTRRERANILQKTTGHRCQMVVFAELGWEFCRRAAIGEGSGHARESADGAVFLRVEHLGEPRIFLEEGEIFIVARVIAIFGP